MKGITFIYCFVILSEATTTQKIISLAVGLVIILAACFIIRSRSNASIKKVLRGWRLSFGPSFEPTELEETPVEEKKVVTIYDFYEDPLDKHHFISPVDPRLTVREATYKNHDLMTFATSWPHLFTDQQLVEIKKMILEITKLACSSHKIVVTKSPAANFSDFKSKLIGEMFAQLHRQYALRFFRQRFLIQKNKDKAIDLIFDSSGDYIDDLSNLLDKCRSIFLSIIGDNITEHKMVVIKNDGSSWQELKTDVLAVVADYFPAGVDWEGQWPEDEPEKPKEIKVPFYFNKFGNLVLEFFGVELSSHIKLLFEASDEIESSHIYHVFDPKKSVLEITIKPEASLAILEQDVRCALAIYDSQTDFALDGEWPQRKNKNSKKISVSFSINNVGQLFFLLPFEINPEPLRHCLAGISGISNIDFGHGFDKSVVDKADEVGFLLSKRDANNWSDLAVDILSAFALSYNEFEFVMEGEWPQDVVTIESDVLGQGSINT